MWSTIQKYKCIRKKLQWMILYVCALCSHQTYTVVGTESYVYVRWPWIVGLSTWDFPRLHRLNPIWVLIWGTCFFIPRPPQTLWQNILRTFCVALSVMYFCIFSLRCRIEMECKTRRDRAISVGERKQISWGGYGKNDIILIFSFKCSALVIWCRVYCRMGSCLGGETIGWFCSYVEKVIYFCSVSWMIHAHILSVSNKFCL